MPPMYLYIYVSIGMLIRNFGWSIFLPGHIHTKEDETPLNRSNKGPLQPLTTNSHSTIVAKSSIHESLHKLVLTRQNLNFASTDFLCFTACRNASKTHLNHYHQVLPHWLSSLHELPTQMCAEMSWYRLTERKGEGEREGKGGGEGGERGGSKANKN